MTDQIILKQKEALVATIKECQKREDLRLSRLAAATSKQDYKFLIERYDRERASEKERIEHLREDLMLLHKKKSEEGLNIPAEERRAQQIENYRLNQGGKYDTTVSRFYGLETLSDVLFQADVTRRFEKKDQRFKNKMGKEHYEPIHDIRKLRLLEQKRDILQQLIQIEDNNSGKSSNRSVMPSARLSSLQYRGSDAMSTYSGSSSSSGYSHATFATSNPTRPLVRTNSLGANRRPPPAVPRLALS